MLFLKGKGFHPKMFFYLMIASCVFLFYYRCFAPIRFRFPAYGYASWYSRSDSGVRKRTANNEIFNDQVMTCAIWGVPFGTQLKVTDQSNGRYVVVRVNDRGPHRKYVREGRVIDLTEAAFRRISKTGRGLIPVRVEKISEE